jgi:hypothetical protein
MRRRRLAVGVVAAVVVIAGVTVPIVDALASGPPDVTTAGYSNLRTDWDSSETALTPTDVQAGKFGKIFSTKLSGSIYAQPLVVGGTAIVTTEQANAYGVNATTGAIAWTRNFGQAFKAKTIGCSDLTPYIGSTSTPVEDPSTGTVYLTTRIETGSGGLANAQWDLQAVNAATGTEVSGYPVPITGTPSNTPGVPFNASYSQQRPGLLLLGGTVYAAFASDCDLTPYRGIVVGVNTSTRAVTMWSDESGIGTDQDSQAGIWQSGAGLVSLGPGNIVLTSGNGVSPQPAASNKPPATLSESVIGLSVGANGTLTPTQFFAPSNAANLDSSDDDFGSGGPVALPSTYFGTSAHPQLLVQVGKDGRIFLLDAASMGGFQQGAGGGDAVLQDLGPYGGVWGHPAVYGGQGGWVYVLESAGGGYLRALSYGVNAQGLPQLTSAGTSTGSFGYTSGSPMVTSNGTTAGSAVVWVVYCNGPSGAKAQLRAYGAIPSNGVLPLLWSAPIGTASKCAVPTAWNGRILVGTREGRLIEFGATSSKAVTAAPVDFGSVPVGTTRTVTLTATAPEAMTVTGAATVSGYQATASPGASPAQTTTTSTTTPAGATAGPATIPVAGTEPVPAGVFTVSSPATGTRVAAGANIPIRVTFTPTGPGAVIADVSIPTSSGTRTVPVSGYGTAPGLLHSSEPLTYGTVLTGSGGKALTATVSNSWNHPETITGVGLPGGPFAVTGAPAVGTVLAPQQSVTVSVRFDPGLAGQYASALTISTDHGSVELPTTGTAVTGYQRLAASSTTVDAGDVPVGQRRDITFQVGNSGTVALIITRALAPSGEFSTDLPMPEGTTVDPGTFLDQHVTFQPTAPGPDSETYTFKSNGGGQVTVTLVGTGT